MTPEETLKRLTSDYATVFTSPQGERVEDDLRIRCGADKTSFDVDPYVTAFNEGRRYVWLQIQSRKNRTDEQILRLLKVKKEVSHE
jgi:hypothetical protein